MRVLFLLPSLVLVAGLTFPGRFEPSAKDDSPSRVDPHHLTLYDVIELLDRVEKKVNVLDGSLSSVETLASVIQGRINFLVDRFQPFVKTSNQQEDATIAEYKKQVQEIRDTIDSALALVAEAASIADSVKNVGLTQKDVLDDVLKPSASDQTQSDLIESISSNLAEQKTEILDVASSNLLDLAIFFVIKMFRISTPLADFLNARACETSNSFIPLEDYTSQTEIFVPFQSVFESTPKVSFFLRGIDAHLQDASPHRHADDVFQNKFVKSVNTTGFLVAVEGASDGSVDVKNLYCSWMACQNLNEDTGLSPN